MLRSSSLAGRARGAAHSGLKAAADGVEQAIALLRSHSFGVIVGSFAYMAFDIAALGFAFAAVGHVPAFGTLVLGYLIGQLGNLIPVPGGIGGTEGALIGVFALYGVDVPMRPQPCSRTASSSWRSRRCSVCLRSCSCAAGSPRADQPAQVCAPLGLEVVELPAPTR